MTDRDIACAVIVRYLAGDGGSDAKQLARRLGVSQARVRAALNRGVDGVRGEQEWRTSYSRDYPLMETGSHRVWVYYPTLDRLAVALRRALGILSDAVAWSVLGSAIDPDEEWAADAREITEEYGDGDRDAELVRP